MKIKHSVVDVRRSEVSTTRVIVPNWEVPILQALHGHGVAVVKEQEVERAAPDAGGEFERLAARYGMERKKDGSLGDPFVQNVYGQHQAGIMNLQRQIDAAVVH